MSDATQDEDTGLPDNPDTYKVQAGITITGEFAVEADNEEEARVVAKRKMRQEPYNYGQISDEFTNNVREWL